MGSNNLSENLILDNQKITDKKEIDNYLAETVTKNSSLKNWSRKGYIIKQNKDKEKNRFQTDNTKNCNQLFSKMSQKYHWAKPMIQLGLIIHYP